MVHSLIVHVQCITYRPVERCGYCTCIVFQVKLKVNTHPGQYPPWSIPTLVNIVEKLFPTDTLLPARVDIVITEGRELGISEVG